MARPSGSLFNSCARRFTMRTLAIIFSVISFYGLLMLVNVEIYHFMPATPGLEGGMIDAAIGFVFGGIASIIALLFSFLNFRRTSNARSSHLLLGWCILVPLCFITIFVYMSVQAAQVGGAAMDNLPGQTT